MLPADWNRSILALLAKIDIPMTPADMRPIAMSSAMQKLVSRMVMGRVFPLLRKGSDIACCGRGRQAADLVGCATRLRDVVKEWGVPLLIAKLDIRGAFDSLDRSSLAKKLNWCGKGRETRYLLQQLAPNTLEGRVPGGRDLHIHCTTGIKQGAPESAEIFALILEAALSEMREDSMWKTLPKPIADLDLDLLMYQDDLFLWDSTPAGLEQRIALIAEALRELGLALAASKTAIVSRIQRC